MFSFLFSDKPSSVLLRISLCVIVLFFTALLCTVIPVVGRSLFDKLIRFFAEADQFGAIFNILGDSIDWNAVLNNPSVPIQYLIVKPSGALSGLNPGATVSAIFQCLLEVGATAILEEFIISFCMLILKNILPELPILNTAIGIVFGLLLCVGLKSGNMSAELRGILRSITAIALMSVGIWLMVKSTFAYNNARVNRRKTKRKLKNVFFFFCIELLIDIITELTLSMYVSLLCLTRYRVTPIPALIIMGILTILVMTGNYLYCKYRELRRKNTTHIGFRDFF